MYFSADSVADLFAVMHSEVNMLSTYLLCIPEEEMGLEGTSGLILSDPVRHKFNHPPPPPPKSTLNTALSVM